MVGPLSFSLNPVSRVPMVPNLVSYHLGGIDFPHHSPCPSELMVLRFPLLAPFGLKLTFST
jgi:hypothetical protein